MGVLIMAHGVLGGCLAFVLLMCLSAVPQVAAKDAALRRSSPASFRRFFDSGRRRRNSDFCFNQRYNTHTEAGECEYDCCWGDSCGSEGVRESPALLLCLCSIFGALGMS